MRRPLFPRRTVVAGEETRIPLGLTRLIAVEFYENSRQLS